MALKAILNRTAASRVVALAVAAFLPTTAISDEVVLKSADGTVNLVGEYVDFVDNNYVIRTALGDLRISAARVSCEGASCPVFETATADVVFAGSDTVGIGLMPLVLAGYASHLDAEASVQATDRDGEILANFVGDGGFGDEIGSFLVTSTTSGDAFKNLLTKDAELGMASRRIKPQEARALKADGGGNMISPEQEHIIAVDSLVVITHPTNPVQSVSIDQLAGIYAGRITNWSQIGGNDAPIKVFNRAEGSGTRSTFYTGIFGDGAENVAPIGVVADDHNKMAAEVNADPNAIGFVGYAFQRGAKPLPLVNSCGITAEPNAFSAKTEEYPLQRRLYLYARADNLPENVSEFLDFAVSEDADAVIAKSGFIDLGVDSQSLDQTSVRAQQLLQAGADAYERGFMQAMVQEMTSYDRLSTTFRFRTGSSRLDERALVDMERLVNFLQTKPDGAKIRIVGFTDSVGSFDNNRGLSVRRAEQVALDLANFAGDRLAGVTVEIAGYGEIAPSACNTTDLGRSINRRVEVWLEAQPQS